MKTSFCVALCLCIASCFPVSGQQQNDATTPNIGLTLPEFDSPNWDQPLNGNFSLLDEYLGGGKILPQLMTWKIFFSGQSSCGGNNTIPASGNVCVYLNTGDGLLHVVNSSGVDTPLGGGGASSSYYQTIQNNGTSVTQRPKLNFLSGASFGIVDDATNNSTDITIPTGGGGGGSTPGGTNGQIQYNANNVLSGFTLSGDGVLDTSTGNLIVTKTNGVSFAPSATVDTTNAANITSGTLPDARLSNAAANTGTFGNATSIPEVTVDAHGRVTSISTVPASTGITSLTGDVTASGVGSVPTTLATVNSNTGTFGSANTVPVITVNGKGLITAVSLAAISGGAGSGWTVGTLASMPSTCSPGNAYFATDQPAGKQLYTCYAANTWTQSLLLGTSGALQVTNGALDITSIVPLLGKPNAFTALNEFGPGFTLDEGTSPGTPASGKDNLYVNSTDHELHIVNSSGTDTPIGSGGSGSLAIQQAGVSQGTATTLNCSTNVTCSVASGTATITASATAATAFSALTGGTNTQATMLVGTGASLAPTGTGTIAATSVGGVTVTGTPTVGQVPTATSGTAATWQTPSGGSGFTGTAGSVPFVGSGGSLTQDNAHFFYASGGNLVVGTNSDSALTEYMDNGIEIYQQSGGGLGKDGLLLAGPNGGAWRFATSVYNNDNFCLSGNNFSACELTMPRLDPDDLYFDGAAFTGSGAAFEILGSSEGGHIYTHGAAPTISSNTGLTGACAPGTLAESGIIATFTSGSTSVTVNSATGIAAGQYIIDSDSDVSDGTTVVSLSGTTLTLSAAATKTASSIQISVVTPFTNNDRNGEITSVATESCTVTFATQWSHAPVVEASGSAGYVGVSPATSTSVALFNGASNVSTIGYHAEGTD